MCSSPIYSQVKEEFSCCIDYSRLRLVLPRIIFMRLMLLYWQREMTKVTACLFEKNYVRKQYIIPREQLPE